MDKEFEDIKSFYEKQQKELQAQKNELEKERAAFLNETSSQLNRIEIEKQKYLESIREERAKDEAIYNERELDRKLKQFKGLAYVNIFNTLSEDRQFSEMKRLIIETNYENFALIVDDLAYKVKEKLDKIKENYPDIYNDVISTGERKKKANKEDKSFLVTYNSNYRLTSALASFFNSLVNYHNDYDDLHEKKKLSFEEERRLSHLMEMVLGEYKISNKCETISLDLIDIKEEFDKFKESNPDDVNLMNELISTDTVEKFNTELYFHYSMEKLTNNSEKIAHIEHMNLFTDYFLKYLFLKLSFSTDKDECIKFDSFKDSFLSFSETWNSSALSKLEDINKQRSDASKIASEKKPIFPFVFSIFFLVNSGFLLLLSIINFIMSFIFSSDESVSVAIILLVIGIIGTGISLPILIISKRKLNKIKQAKKAMNS